MTISMTKYLAGRPFLLVLVLLGSTYGAAGQSPGGIFDTDTRLSGINYIVGTVFAPSGHPVNRRLRIELSSLAGRDIVATTDDEGSFVFTGVRPGNYDIVIDREEGFEPIVYRIDVLRSSAPVTYTVILRLRATAEYRAKPAVVNVSDRDVPKRASDLFQKASELEKAGDLKGAVEKLKLATAQYPAYFSAYSQMGVLYLRQNDFTKADEALKAALAIKPDAYAPLVNRGIALFRLDRFAEAEAVFRAALKAKPDSAGAYYNLARVADRLGQTENAERAYLESIKLSPGEFKEAHRSLAIIYHGRKSYAAVIEQLEAYLNVVPTAADAADLRKIIEQCKLALGSHRTEKTPEN